MPNLYMHHALMGGFKSHVIKSLLFRASHVTSIYSLVWIGHCLIRLAITYPGDCHFIIIQIELKKL